MRTCLSGTTDSPGDLVPRNSNPAYERDGQANSRTAAS
jgi:hypothetical protein